jgi:Domain of unknown function DUF11
MYPFSDQRKRIWTPTSAEAPAYHANECLNFYAKWCGDGVVDATDGELYDDGAQNGQPGKANASCTALVPVVPPPVAGVCGSASNTVTATAPTTNLCSVGTATLVSGGTTGPWTWTCGGTNGGAPSPICKATPPVVVPPAPLGFGLSLKKYINNSGVDAQPGSEVNMIPRTLFSYIIRVANDGPGPVTGETVVTDTLPGGVALSSSPSGSPWACTVSGVTVTCKVTASIPAGQNFPDITIPVELTATTVGQIIRNDATVSNPGDTTPGNNTDPAVIIVKPSPACGSVNGNTALTSPIIKDANGIYNVNVCSAGSPIGFSENTV